MKNNSSIHEDDEEQMLIKVDAEVATEQEPTLKNEEKNESQETINKFKDDISHFSDDESFILKKIGSKQKLYQEIINQDTPINQVYRLALIANMMFLLYLFFFICLFQSVIYFYQHPETKGKSFVIVTNVIAVVRLITSIIWLSRVPMLTPDVKSAILMEIFSTIFSLIGGIAFYFYLDGLVSIQIVVYFVLPTILIPLIFLILAVKGKIVMKPILPIISIFMGFQYLWIVLNLAYFHWNNWVVILIFFYIIAILGCVYSSLIAILTIVLFFYWFFQFRRQFNDYAISAFILSFLIFASTAGFIFYFFFNGLRRLIQNGNIFVEHPQTVDMDMYLLTVCVIFKWVIAFILVFNAITSVFAFWKIKKMTSISKKFTNEVNHYKTKLLMQISLVSKDYFKKKSKIDENEKENNNLFEKCIVCEFKDADCMLYPCGHTGFCMSCLREDQKIRNTCMVCKRQVTKAKKLVYDPDKKKYYSTLEELFYSGN